MSPARASWFLVVLLAIGSVAVAGAAATDSSTGATTGVEVGANDAVVASDDVFAAGHSATVTVRDLTDARDLNDVEIINRTVNGGVRTDGDVSIVDSEVNGRVQADGDVSIDGSDLNGGARADGDVEIVGTGVNGGVQADGDVVLVGTTVTGSVSADGDVSLTAGSSVGGSVHADGTLSISEDSDVAGATAADGGGDADDDDSGDGDAVGDESDDGDAAGGDDADGNGDDGGDSANGNGQGGNVNENDANENDVDGNGDRDESGESGSDGEGDEDETAGTDGEDGESDAGNDDGSDEDESNDAESDGESGTEGGADSGGDGGDDANDGAEGTADDGENRPVSEGDERASDAGGGTTERGEAADDDAAVATDDAVEPTVTRRETGTGVTVELRDVKRTEPVTAPLDLSGPGSADPAVSLSGITLEFPTDRERFDVDVSRPAADADGLPPVPRGEVLAYVGVDADPRPDRPIDTTVRYELDATALPDELGPEAVRVMRYADDGWTTDGVSHESTANGRAVTLSRPASFALTIPEPGPVEVVDAEIEADWVLAGHEAWVQATVRNDGERTATRTVPVAVDGDPIAERELTVPPGEIDTVRIPYEPDRGGTVTVDGVEAGTVDVAEEGTEESADGGDAETGDEAPGFGVVLALVAIVGTALGVRVRRR